MPNALKRFNFYLLLGMDTGLIVLAHVLAYLTRFEFVIPHEYLGRIGVILPALVLIKLVCFFFFRLYRGMWRYTSLPDLINILKAVTASSLLLVGYVALTHRFAGFSRSVFLLDWLYTALLVGGLRIGIRWSYGLGVADIPSLFRPRVRPAAPKRCVLLGAGRAGEKLLREVMGDPAPAFVITALFDDDPDKQGRMIHGVPIVGPLRSLKAWIEAGEVQPDEALIAIPSESGPAMREAVSRCEEAGLPYRRVPSLSEIASGRISIKNLRDVDYKDLLGRETVTLDTERISGALTGKTVLITGAGGSIGSELCRQILAFKPARLLILDACEYNLYQLQMELEHERNFKNYVPLLGSLKDGDWTTWVLETHRPDVVFHAAAYKHVPMLEANPDQAVTNNVLSTLHLVQASVRLGVERLLVVSTDKAVRPTNVMGASKRVTEKIMQASCGQGTKLMAVRFGNVIGSAGSVVPLFRRQIEHGGPVTVTDPEVIRYFMTIEEASQLIIQAATMGGDGEIFLLKMGQPVKIAEMAKDLVRLSGKEPGKDVEIKFIGLRPGEKLYEELITDDEGVVPTQHDKIMVLRGAGCESEELLAIIDEMRLAAQDRDPARIRQILGRAVPEYAPDTNGKKPASSDD
ncbi:polysaccharide biosynthesis protein [Desulfocurvus sp. DL9XJH121]